MKNRAFIWYIVVVDDLYRAEGEIKKAKVWCLRDVQNRSEFHRETLQKKSDWHAWYFNNVSFIDPIYRLPVEDLLMRAFRVPKRNQYPLHIMDRPKE